MMIWHLCYNTKGSLTIFGFRYKLVRLSRFQNSWGVLAEQAIGCIAGSWIEATGVRFKTVLQAPLSTAVFKNYFFQSFSFILFKVNCSSGALVIFVFCQTATFMDFIQPTCLAVLTMQLVFFVFRLLNHSTCSIRFGWLLSSWGQGGSGGIDQYESSTYLIIILSSFFSDTMYIIQMAKVSNK